jgi:hypothetical protein
MNAGAPTPVMIGLGTGRCGTHSLAALIAMQPGAIGTHERHGADIAWVGGEREVDRVLDELAADLAAGATLVGEIGLYYLPYVARIRARFPTARFVVLQRDRARTVESFMEKTADKSNHWAPTARFARHARWDHCFPTYDAALSKRDAIGRYWDEYYATTAALERAEPQAFLTVRTEELGTVATQRRILDFLGLPPAAQQVSAGLASNRAEDVAPSLGKRLRRWWRGRFGGGGEGY